MENDFELFGTQAEAMAFVKGFRQAVEMADFDQAYCCDPESQSTGEWRVIYGYNC